MSIRLGVVMDPIAGIHYEKDTTLAMLLAASARGIELYYFELIDLFLRDGVAYGRARPLNVFADSKAWFQLGESQIMPLADLNIILMRKDPPFNETYFFATYLLEYAERQGVRVINRPQALRDANEKLFTGLFPELCPPTLVTQSSPALHAFWQEHGDIVCKPLNAMGGASVFRLKRDEANANVIFATLTEGNARYIMAQRFIPEIAAGDKRILLINGKAIPHALARVPSGKDWRGNLAVGAKGKVQDLTARDQFICERIGATLQERGLYFAGIDVIGDYLTEINVTSPTGMQEIMRATEANIAATFIDFILSLR